LLFALTVAVNYLTGADLQICKQRLVCEYNQTMEIHRQISGLVCPNQVPQPCKLAGTQGKQGRTRNIKPLGRPTGWIRLCYQESWRHNKTQDSTVTGTSSRTKYCSFCSHTALFVYR